MSYRKKRHSSKSKAKSPKEPQPTLFLKEYRSTGEMRMLPTNRLTSGQAYQRPVEEKDVDKLIRKWDDRLLNPLIVSFRDGHFFIVDGQHRAAALRKMNDGADVIVMCRVHDDLTYEMEAELYAKLDKANKRMTLSQSTNALIESGTDAEVIEIKRLVEKNGFRWALSIPTGKEYEIAATRAVINAYRLLGGAAFDRMLQLLSDTWQGAPNSLRAAMLSGLALFLKTYESELDNAIFIECLSLVEPESIIRCSRQDFSTGSVALRYARVLLEKENSQPDGSKQPYRIKT